MARKKSPTLTDAELRLMDVLWNKGEATVSDVVDSVSKDAPLHYSTVLTTLRILENKGYIRHRKDGRAFIYQAAVARDEAQRSAITHVLKRFFDDSPALLMLNLPQKSSRRGERSALRHLIDKFYDGSTEKIVAALLGVKGSKLSPEELNRIAAMVESARGKTSHDDISVGLLLKSIANSFDRVRRTSIIAQTVGVAETRSFICGDWLQRIHADSHLDRPALGGRLFIRSIAVCRASANCVRWNG